MKVAEYLAGFTAISFLLYYGISAATAAQSGATALLVAFSH